MTSIPDLQDPNRVQAESDATMAVASAKRPSYLLRGVILLFFGIILLAGTSVIAYQHWFGPKVDESLFAGDVVKKTEPTDSREPELGTGISAMLTEEAIANSEHPLTLPLKLAKLGIVHIDETIKDYEAVVEKQCRPGKKLGPEQHMFVKVRHERVQGKKTIPFSVYTRFLAPQSIIGQEAIYVDGWHENRLVAHLPGLMNIRRFYFKPTNPLVMRGNLHPITMLGFKNLLIQILEKGQSDLAYDECEVKLERNIEIDGRKCLLIEITHPVERDHFEFHIARVYWDLEYDIPVGYEGYLWPEEEGGEPRLLERYIYSKVKLNQGFRNVDFSADNDEYDFPK